MSVKKSIFTILPLAVLLAANPAQAVDQAALDKLATTNACENCDLSGADLTNSPLKFAGLDGANLTNAKMSGAILDKASLIGADLTGANLAGADLSHANLSNAKLISVDLTDANLSSAIVHGTTLIKSDVTDASFFGVNMGNFGNYDSNTECRTVKPNGAMANHDC